MLFKYFQERVKVRAQQVRVSPLVTDKTTRYLLTIGCLEIVTVRPS